MVFKSYVSVIYVLMHIDYVFSSTTKTKQMKAYSHSVTLQSYLNYLRTKKLFYLAFR
jgi:hypothetical protein